MGRGTYGDPVVLHWGEAATLRVGAFCSIAPEVTIFLGGNHRVDWITTYPFSELWDSAKGIPGHPATGGDVVIGNDVWLGLGATILSGVVVADGAVVAASSVVTHDVRPFEIVAGNPARSVRCRFRPDEVDVLLRLAWWGWPDAKIDAAMSYLLSSDVAGLRGFSDAYDHAALSP